MIKAHISYVATVFHDRRSDSRVQQFLDHTHNFVFFTGFFTLFIIITPERYFMSRRTFSLKFVPKHNKEHTKIECEVG